MLLFPVCPDILTCLLTTVAFFRINRRLFFVFCNSDFILTTVLVVVSEVLLLANVLRPAELLSD